MTAADVEMEPSVEDRVAIDELCARYNWAADDGRGADVAELFTEDGVLDGPGGRFEGRAAIAGFIDDLHRRRPGSAHLNSNRVIAASGGDVVEHSCYLSFLAPGDAGTDTVLFRYHDELVRSDGRWRFRSRRCRAMS